MKTLPLLLAVLCFVLLGQDRPGFNIVRTERGNVLFSITAKNVEKESGSVVILTNATVTTKVLNISANEMKYDQDTGAAELRGNVRVKISK
jgi:hypothetical protein